MCVFGYFFFFQRNSVNLANPLRIRFDELFHCVISSLYVIHSISFSFLKQVHHLSSTSYSLKTILKHSMDEWNEFYWVIELLYITNLFFCFLKIKNYLHSSSTEMAQENEKVDETMSFCEELRYCAWRDCGDGWFVWGRKGDFITVFIYMSSKFFLRKTRIFAMMQDFFITLNIFH